MTRPARIPPEPSSFAGEPARPGVDAADTDGPEPQAGGRSGRVDADVDLGSQRRFGELKHNLTNRWMVQDR